jgi:DNA-binding NarL/FixJ family response regulator
LRIIIADDHRLTLNGIRHALEGVDDIEVVGETQSGTDVPRLVDQTQPDMVLMDVWMPGLDGLSALNIIRRHHPTVKVVLLSAHAEPEKIKEGLDRGAVAFIVKSVNPEDLPSALRHAFEGTVYSFPAAGLGAAQSAVPLADRCELTERELAVLRAVASGLSNKAISREMWVTEQTVKFHLTNIYRKLGVPNRTAAARCAQTKGLLDDHSLVGSAAGAAQVGR